MANCINCGAIIHGDKCEYCGTEYKHDGITANFNKNDLTGTMKINGEEIKVYISHVDISTVDLGQWMDVYGMLHTGEVKKIRTFTVVEY